MNKPHTTPHAEKSLIALGILVFIVAPLIGAKP